MTTTIRSAEYQQAIDEIMNTTEGCIAVVGMANDLRRAGVQPEDVDMMQANAEIEKRSGQCPRFIGTGKEALEQCVALFRKNGLEGWDY